jgi:hypothetical protein
MSHPRRVVPSGLAALSGLVALVGVAALSACDVPPQTGQAQADAETRAACQKRANEVYDQQNRGEIYSPQSQVNTPYSANYTPDLSNRGLSDLFVHDRMISDCIRNSGTGTERSEPPSAAASTLPLPLPPPPPPRH